MRSKYSLRSAIAKLSAIVKRVREGHTVMVTGHGERPLGIRPVSADKPGIEARIAEFLESGVVAAPATPDISLRAVARRPGALKRFLDTRDA